MRTLFFTIGYTFAGSDSYGPEPTATDMGSSSLKNDSYLEIDFANQATCIDVSARNEESLFFDDVEGRAYINRPLVRDGYQSDAEVH